MRVTLTQLRKLIKESVSMLKEYEQYVDEDGNVWDDEGNVVRRGKSFGSRYGGQTYGTRAPWSKSRRSAGAKRSSRIQIEPELASQLQSVLASGSLGRRDKEFLESVLQRGYAPSEKQQRWIDSILSRIPTGAQDDDPDTNNDGALDAEELNVMVDKIKDDLSERKLPITIKELKLIIAESFVREAFDTKLSRARSKGNLPDARPDEKRASRRAERRFGTRVAHSGFGDVEDEDDFLRYETDAVYAELVDLLDDIAAPGWIKWNLEDGLSKEEVIAKAHRGEARSKAWMTKGDLPMSGLGPADDHLESITSQDMADAKRYAKSDLPRDQADYLDISVEDWHRIRQELDDHYEDRHMDDQLAFDDDPDVNDDGVLDAEEISVMIRKIKEDL